MPSRPIRAGTPREQPERPYSPSSTHEQGGSTSRRSSRIARISMVTWYAGPKTVPPFAADHLHARPPTHPGEDCLPLFDTEISPPGLREERHLMFAMLAEHPGGSRFPPRFIEVAGKSRAVELASETDAPVPVDAHHLPEAVVVRVHRVRDGDDDSGESLQELAAPLRHRYVGIEEVCPGLDIRCPRGACRKDEYIGIPYRGRFSDDRDVDTRVLQVEHLRPEEGGLVYVVDDDLVYETERGGEERRFAPPTFPTPKIASEVIVSVLIRVMV